MATWVEERSSGPQFQNINKEVAKAEEEKGEASGYHDVRQRPISGKSFGFNIGIQ